MARAIFPAISIAPTCRSGRITPDQLDGALAPLVRSEQVTLGSESLLHRDVLRACLTDGLCAPIIEPLERNGVDPDSDLVRQAGGQAGRRPADPGPAVAHPPDRR